VTIIAVIGASVAGQEFARASALAGYPTVFEDVSREMLERGIAQISERADAAALARIVPVLGVETAIRDADLIIEAVPEELEMKLELFTVFDKFAKPGAIFATTAETLAVADISDVTVYPERCVGMRWRGETLELTRTAVTSEDAMQRCSEVAKRMAKEFRWVGDVAGG
jgi:3-hydroxybutyryl-CoA dehydrogenase